MEKGIGVDMAIISILIVTFLLCVVIDKVYEAEWKKNLTADVAFSVGEVRAGEQLDIIETVANDKYMIIPAVQVKFSLSRHLVVEAGIENVTVTDQSYKYDTFSLGVRQRIKRTIPIKKTKRGFYAISRVDVVSKGIFFRGHNVMSFPVNSQLHIYPTEFDVDFVKQASGKIYGEFASKIRVFDEPFSFRGIRDYDVNDPMNAVNWKATARTGGLMTNLRDYQSSFKVMLLLNLEDSHPGTSEEIKEDCISIAAGVIRELLRLGIQVGLISNGIGTDGSESEKQNIVIGCDDICTYERYLRRLSEIELDAGQEEFTNILSKEKDSIQDDMMVVVISVNHNTEFLEMVGEIMESHDGSIFIAPYENDDRWWESNNCEISEVLPWSRQESVES